jgi:dTDP-4-dehydrorhamnose reductase
LKANTGTTFSVSGTGVAERPADSRLAMSMSLAEGLPVMPHWRDELKREMVG